MEHKKAYHAIQLKTDDANLIIEGPLTGNQLAKLQFHHDLTAFRPAPEQHAALIEIADLPEGRIIVARRNDIIVGYVTYLHPDPLERWSQGNMENLLELGAIEVIPAFRRAGVGKSLLKVSMMDDQMEDYIIISTEYYWHWDLKGTGLNIWEYRRVMEKMMNAGGLVITRTDDPEISLHPANCLMVRIGNRVDEQSIKQFDALRFLNRKIYK